MFQSQVFKSFGYKGSLEYSDELPILGIPVVFRSNNPTVIERVNSTFGHWKNLPEEIRESRYGLTVDIIVQDFNDGSPPALYDFHCVIHNDTRLASCGKNQLCANRSTGKSLAYVTQDLVLNEPAFAWFVIEPLAFFLVNSKKWATFHSAAVTFGDRAFTFIGKSGSGKSCLTYACLKKGFSLLSEDVIYVGTDPESRIWGNATKVHLLPDSKRLFPELNDHQPVLRPNGKIKLTVPLTEINNCTAALHAQSITVCLIEPNHESRESSLKQVSSDNVSEAVLTSLEPGFDLYEEKLPAALERLLHNQAYRLKVGNDLNATTDLLLNLV